MSETVKAVGFAFLAPEVIVIHFRYGRQDRIHLYPPLFDEEFDLSDPNKRHIVALRDVNKRYALREYHNNIHRLLIFGKPDDLDKIGVPVIDAVTKDGKVIQIPRQMPDVVSTRIRKEAVLIDLTPPAKAKSTDQDDEEATEKPRRRLAWWLDKVLAEVEDKSQHESIKMAAFHRLVDNISKEDFRRACNRMRKRMKIKKSIVAGFYRWVEGIDGDGVFLGKAVNYYFDDAQEDDEEVSIDAIAADYKVDAGDIRLVVAALEDDEDDE